MRCTILLFIFAFSCSESKSTDKKNTTLNIAQEECLHNIINADNTLGAKRNLACRRVSLTATIDEYVNGLNKLDYSNCPIEFTAAFKSHMDSWIALKIVTDRYTELRGEMHDLFKQLELSSDSSQFKVLQNEIWSTWKEVEVLIEK